MMNSVSDLIDKFDTLYKDIDIEINKIQNSAKCQPQKYNFSENSSKNFKSDKNIEGILNAAKKINEDVKTIVGKKDKRKKNYQPQKSFMPPIWDEQKLNYYVQNILNDIMTSPVEETKEVILGTTENKPEGHERSTIYGENKNDAKKNLTRNVGTNIHFLIHGTEENNLNVKQNLGVMRMNRKTQTSYRNDLKIGVNKANEKLFPKKVERIVNNDESVNVNFKKHMNIPNTPQQLAFSATTFTSTNGHKKSTKSDDIIHVVDSNLVTDKTKQMSAVFLPVISIKSKCCIQKVYNFEVSPAVTEANRKECNKRNVKFFDLEKESKCIDSQEKASHIEHVEENTVKEATESKNTLINIQDVKNVLRHHKVNVDDGKIHIIVKNVREKDTKKKKIKRPKEFKKVGYKRIEKKNVLDKKKLPPDSNKNEKIKCEADSSSSLTDDDRKLCDILKFYGEMNEPKKRGNKDENILSHEDRYTTYPYPTNTSSNETHNNLMTNEVKNGNDLEYNNITESFQSIYKLIEATFQSNNVETKVYENEDENGVSEMNQVIKMSEENIKKAEMLLQKYQITKDEMYPFTLDKTQKSPHNSMTEKPKIFDVNHEVNSNSERRDKGDEYNANNSCHFKETSAQDMNEGSLMQCQNYATFTEELQHRMQRNIETSDMCIQTTSDKALQTDDNFNWKSRFYFKSVYDNYNNIDFDKSKVSSIKKIDKIPNVDENIDSSVPYNSIYSNDDEILKVANKFLRSIEKEKKKKNSAEHSFNDYNSQDLTELSSYRSTPLSDILFPNNMDYEISNESNSEKPVLSHYNVECTSSGGELLSLGEVKVSSSLSEESSIDF
ncbi:interaptin-like [Chironomus tepperi]|uniref:interaptin-like n=1 Tax=Chironomus tepperi TaxID=113505 RepID=UPI00391F8D02